MAFSALEQRHVSLAGYHDLDDRPGFKLAIQEIDGRWLVYLGHLFHSGWSIVDVTDPREPTLVRYVEGPANTVTKQVQVADGILLTGLERPARAVDDASGDTFDPAGPAETGASLWDVSTDSTDPRPLGTYRTGGLGTHRNFYAGGDFAYLCACPEGYEPERFSTTNPHSNYFLVVIDLSDPTDPNEVARWLLPEQDPGAEAEHRESFYLHGPAYVSGERAYLSYGRAGVVLLEVSDPTDPTLLTRLDFGPGLGAYNGVHSVIPVPDTNLAAVNSEAVRPESPLDEGGDPLQYTFLVELSEETAPGFDGTAHRGPRVISSLPMPTPEAAAPYGSYYEKPGWFGPHNQHHPRGESSRLQSSELLFFAYFNAGLRIFDISDPLTPVEAGYYVPEPPNRSIGRRRSPGSQFEDVLVDARGYIYCTDPHRGLYIFETDLL